MKEKMKMRLSNERLPVILHVFGSRDAKCKNPLVLKVDPSTRLMWRTCVCVCVRQKVQAFCFHESATAIKQRRFRLCRPSYQQNGTFWTFLLSYNLQGGSAPPGARCKRLGQRSVFIHSLLLWLTRRKRSCAHPVATLLYG